MTPERLEEILEEDSMGEWLGDNALHGLNIIAKYFSVRKEILVGADHDVIYSVGIDELAAAGITEEDAKKLRELNWMVDCSSLACFV